MAHRFLFKVWRMCPEWLQHIFSRIVRPLFQAFVAAALFDDDKRILLVKVTYKATHAWGLPGGSLNYREIPEDGVAREALEEIGLNIEAEKLLFVKTWNPDLLGLYYLCRIYGGEFRLSDEVCEYGYFSTSELPDVHPLDVDVIKQIFELAEQT